MAKSVTTVTENEYDERSNLVKQTVTVTEEEETTKTLQEGMKNPEPTPGLYGYPVPYPIPNDPFHAGRIWC